MAPAALVLVSLSVLSGAGPPPTATEDPAKVAEARKYYEAGKSAYTAGRYVAAASAFQEAHALSPRPPILFATAQAFRRQYTVYKVPADLERAVFFYRAYLDAVPQGGERDAAVGYLGDLEPVLEKVGTPTVTPERAAVAPEPPTQFIVTSQTPGARASIDGGDLTEVPVVRDVEPGAHQVQVQAPGFHPRTDEAFAVKGRLIVVQAELQPEPALVRIDVSSAADVEIDGRRVDDPSQIELPAGLRFLEVTQRGHLPFAAELDLGRGQSLDLDVKLDTTDQRYIAYSIFGVAGASAIAGGITTALTFSSQASAEGINADRGAGVFLVAQDRLDYEDAVQRRDDLRVVSTGLLISAGVVALSGALLYFFDHPRSEGRIERSTPVAPEPTDDGFDLSAVGRPE